jgi:hypothetical protein
VNDVNFAVLVLFSMHELTNAYRQVNINHVK